MTTITLQEAIDFDIVNKKEYLKYFKSHVEPIKSRPGFYIVTKQILAFKAIRASKNNNKIRIASLIIPVGARVYCCNYKGAVNTFKLRANSAYVHSIHGLKGGVKNTGVSDFDSDFKYKVGNTVEPSYFYEGQDICSGGIHFFLTFSKAYNYLSD